MVACSMKDRIIVKWCSVENSDEVLKISRSLKVDGVLAMAVGCALYVLPTLLMIFITEQMRSSMIVLVLSIGVGSIPLLYGLFLIRAAKILVTTEEIGEVRKVAGILGYCPLSLMWGGVLGGRLLSIIANDKVCTDRFVIRTCIVYFLIVCIVFCVLSAIYIVVNCWAE